jgi:8-oxo-dGTP pyrophosphatase MutT (NUDIX family)
MNALANRLRRSFAAYPEADQPPFIHHADLIGPLDTLVPAAVLVPIIDAPRPRVLLTVRHADLRAHAGQVAFPGGRIDPEDDGPIGAALREAWEEVGLPIDRVDIVGVGRGYATGTNYLITPVVGVIPDGLELNPHQAEVADVFEVPLDHLVDDINQLRRSQEWQGVMRHYYEIDWPDERIWGVTAGLIVNLSPRLRDAIASPA